MKMDCFLQDGKRRGEKISGLLRKRQGDLRGTKRI